jgi:Ca2+/Na+ antiporter
MGAAVGLYVAARVGSDAVARLAGDTPFVRAVFHWIPVAAVALTAAASAARALKLTGTWDVDSWNLCIGTIFGSSVAALCLIPGIVASSGATAAVPRRGIFVLPAAMLVLLCGFSGKLTVWHAGALAIEGVMIGSVALGKRRGARDVLPGFAAKGVAVIDVLLCLSLVGLTAWAANQGMRHAVMEMRGLTPNLVGSLVLGPLLMLPLIGTAQALSAEGRAADAAALPVPIVLLNLCLLLPVAIVVSLRGQDLMAASDPFPMMLWRIDSVLLTILAAFFVPGALGRWRLHRGEGVLLVACYCVYMVLALKSGIRPA